MPDSLFDSAFLSKLEQLHLLTRKIFRGDRRAERKSRHAGASLEFADYRNYTFGDDLRNIDWNIYGRLDRLFVKLFEEEQDLHVHLLVDASASMLWTPEGNADRLAKFDQARRIAASLAYIALANLDRVNVFFFDETLIADMGLSRGKSHFHKVLTFLQRQMPGPARVTDLRKTARVFTQQLKRRGLVFVLSDFLDPAGYEEALSVLQFNRFDIHAVQILDPAEIEPPLTGDLRLTDAESGARLDLTANPALLRNYTRAITTFRDDLAHFCKRRGIGYAFAPTGVPFEDQVLRVLREGRLVK